MKQAWQIKKLGEVCVVDKTHGIHKALPYVGLEQIESNTGRFVGSVEPFEVKSSSFKFSPEHVLYGRLRPYLNKVLLPNFSGHCSTEIFPLKPHTGLSRKFLQYWFLRDATVERINSTCTGARMPRANMNAVLEFEFPLPSSSEQQRIVGILDEAFEGIATAKANAEKNLQNAHALFESHLQSIFTQRGKGWVEKPLGDLASFRNGINYTKDSKGEHIKIVGVRNFQKHFFAPLDDLDTVTIDGKLSELDALRVDDILAVRSNGNIQLIGRCILVGEVTEKISHSGFTIRIRLLNSDVVPKYLCYFMKSASSRKRLTDGGTGTNIKSLNQGMLSTFAIPFPPISVQKVLVKKLESLSEKTERLFALYLRKLTALEALKKSLLHQAFTGRLTEKAQKAVVIPFPKKISSVTPTDIHAGVLAIAYQFHEKKHKQQVFGHVKAEKIAHLVEARLGIDLGRYPIKDAAGPNDYPHLKAVEHRAKMAGFFVFQGSKKTGYRFAKRPSFDALVEKTRGALGDQNQALDDLLDLMAPMSTQQAEIFATVYAAWNNLLLERLPVTDESIVFEARENWHADKLAIPREKFFKAIRWIRDKGVVPDGKGKKVQAKPQKAK